MMDEGPAEWWHGGGVCLVVLVVGGEFDVREHLVVLLVPVVVGLGGFDHV